MHVVAGVPGVLAALVLAYNTNLFGAITHYSCGQAAVYYGAGYVDLPDVFKMGIIMAVINAVVWGAVGSRSAGNGNSGEFSHCFVDGGAAVCRLNLSSPTKRRYECSFLLHWTLLYVRNWTAEREIYHPTAETTSPKFSVKEA
ncbi:hypothetical protein MLD38_013455 [Melastoma candidum]|uniref:Uncharacterized protein n=1 Tax=Melastoma candidum TaxID=119954 RepID=A0ACB9RDT6_9MYRT|nr:hypothetical protein MLD38_013455 [Melastoma candidum]